MNNTRKKKAKISTKVIYVFLSILAVIYLLPLLWVIYVSLKDDKTLFVSPWAMPEHLMIENYSFAWTAGRLGVATLNSAIVCGVTLILCLLVGSMAAFAIGRMRWKLSGAMMTYFLTGMMIPVHCILIPVFTRFSKMHLTNSLTGLILPYLTLSLPITIFIMTGFFQSLPNELFESACIDGCSIYRSFTHIALPLSRTGLFVTGLIPLWQTGTNCFWRWYSFQTTGKRRCRYPCQNSSAHIIRIIRRCLRLLSLQLYQRLLYTVCLVIKL